MPHTIATQNEKSDTKIEEDDGKHNKEAKRQSAECDAETDASKQQAGRKGR
jgi:hypothetical protein